MRTDQNIRSWIRHACDSNDVAELAQAFLVEWNRRFTRRLGDGHYSLLSMRARIRLSLPLWPRASEVDRRETVIHEVCHVIVFYKYGVFVRPHGAEWRQAMKNCGVQPVRTHNVDRTGLARQQRRFILLDCPNETKCRIGAKQFNQVRKGKELWCKVCGLHLDRESAVEEEDR